MPAEPRVGQRSLARAAATGEGLLGHGSTRMGADKAGCVDTKPYSFTCCDPRQSASKLVFFALVEATKNPAKAGFSGAVSYTHLDAGRVEELRHAQAIAGRAGTYWRVE